MFFSVIVPIYNVAPYLRQCLDSLVHQTCTDKEIILIDDGSTDASGEICDEYAGRYDCVRVVHQKNQGLSGARNIGLAIAKGEWISFIDSDDWVDTNMFERMQGYILATNADMYRFGSVRTNKDKNKTRNLLSRRVSYKGAILNVSDEQALFRYYIQKYKVFLNVLGGTYRHSIISEHKLRFVDTAEVCWEDVLFNFQYILHTREIVVLQDTPYHYRVRRGSLTHVTGAEQKLLGVSSLLERAYQTTVEQGLVYFQQNFYRIYIRFFSFQLAVYAKELNDAQVRQILDKGSKSKLYRKCVRQQLKEDGDTPTEERKWYRKSFGKKGKSVLEWRVYLFLKRIKYVIKDGTPQTLKYVLCNEQRVAYAVNSKGACSSIIVSMMRRGDILDDYSVFEKARKQKILQPLSPICDKKWFTFTFVRNPFARLVSCYESKYHEDKTKYSIDIRYGWLNMDYYLDGYIKEDKGFEHFIKQIIRIPYPMEDKHFCSQYHRFVGKDGKPLVDFIGKVEHLKDDYEPIRQKYGFDPLLHYNKVEYGEWRDYYTTALAKKVYRKYKKDVQYFGYEQEYRDLLEYCARKEKE